MIKHKFLKILIIILILFTSFIPTTSAQESDFVPITPDAGKLGITEIAAGEVPSLNSIVNSAFKIGIAIAGSLAVIMIIFGGIQYMTTDAISGKQEGRERINHAIMGLLLTLSAWLILNTINSSLVDINFKVEKAQISAEELDIPEIDEYGARNYKPSRSSLSREDFGTVPTSFPEQEWNEMAYKAILESGILELNPKDAEEFFRDGQINPENYVRLLAAMSKFESGYDPNQTYTESFKDNNGVNVKSTGLLQISQESVRGYANATNNSEFKKITTQQLKDPETNIRASVMILKSRIQKDGVIAQGKTGGAAYWSVLRGDKREAISQSTLNNDD